jgi:hypothetical protein
VKHILNALKPTLIMKRSGQILAVAISSVLITSAHPATAQDAPLDGARCAILGPMAVSSWFGVLEAAGSGDREKNRDAVTTLEAVVSLYGAIGCPVPALEATLDCISRKAIDGDMQGGPSSVAQSCMSEAGLTAP